jgi:hypothetical protein
MNGFQPNVPAPKIATTNVRVSINEVKKYRTTGYEAAAVNDDHIKI